MRDYSKSIIYKLCCDDIEVKEIYIGSTTNFKNRKYNHKSKCNSPNDENYNIKVYRFIRDNGGWGNFSMILVERYNAEDKRDLEKRERYYKELFKSSLNTNTPGRTKKEYRQDNKERLNEISRQYHQDNKEQIQQQSRQYREDNKEQIQQQQKQKFSCECGGKYTYQNKKQHEKTIKHLNYINSSILS